MSIASTVTITQAEYNDLTAKLDTAKDYQRVCELIGSIYFFGKFKAETPNEIELESLLRKRGYFFESENQLMAKLHPGLFTK